MHARESWRIKNRDGGDVFRKGGKPGVQFGVLVMEGPPGLTVQRSPSSSAANTRYMQRVVVMMLTMMVGGVLVSTGEVLGENCW